MSLGDRLLGGINNRGDDILLMFICYNIFIFSGGSVGGRRRRE